MADEKILIDNEERFVSLAPHIRSNDTVTKIMRDVLIALLPAIIGSVYFFGPRALSLTVVSVLSCVVFEYIMQKLLKKPIRINDLSAVVTGVLIAFNVPVSSPYYMVIFGSFVAIVIVKECFGGIGFNFMNPAIVARLVMMASWPKEMTNYMSPELARKAVGVFGINQDVITQASDAISGATPLQIIKAGNFAELPELSDLFIGNIGGVIGETSTLLLLIGAIYLIYKKVITPLIPVIYIAVTAILLALLGIAPEYILYEICSGGLILGAFFMATDYTTSPMTKKGKIIFAIGLGIITAIIRAKGGLPEGVSYAIAFMNVATPLIDKFTRNKIYGEAKS